MRGASQQGLEARGETPPHTLAEGPQEQSTEVGTGQDLQVLSVWGERKVRQRTGMASQEVRGLECHTGKCGQRSLTTREGLYRRPEKKERECRGREGRPAGKIRGEKRWWGGRKAGALGSVARQ